MLNDDTGTQATGAVAPATPAAPIPPLPTISDFEPPQRQERSARGLAPHRVRVVLTYIEEHFAKPVCVKQLAATVHMSAFHFARMFKIAVGKPPHAYITDVRIDRAKHLLAETNLPLVDVAARVGYQTQAHFTGVFHKHAGTTPRAYRLASQANRATRPQ